MFIHFVMPCKWFVHFENDLHLFISNCFSPHFVFNLFASLSLFPFLLLFFAQQLQFCGLCRPPVYVKLNPCGSHFAFHFLLCRMQSSKPPNTAPVTLTAVSKKNTETKTGKILTKIKIGWKTKLSNVCVCASVCVCVWLWVCLWMHPRQPHAACWALGSLQRSRYFIFLHYMFFMLFSNKHPLKLPANGYLRFVEILGNAKAIYNVLIIQSR